MDGKQPRAERILGLLACVACLTLAACGGGGGEEGGEGTSTPGGGSAPGAQRSGHAERRHR